MADAQSDAEKIRQRRLAKLGGGGATGTVTPSAESSALSNQENTPSVPTPAISTVPTKQVDQADSPVAQKQSASNPFDQLSQPVAKATAPGIRIHNTASQTSAPASRPRPSQTGISIEAWADRTIRTAFRLTLDPNEKKDAHGHDVKYLEETRKDIEEEGKPMLLGVEQLDGALIEAGRTPLAGTTTCYFLGCWKRIDRQFRQGKSQSLEEAKMDILRTARYTCFSNIIWSATMPSMFEQDEPERNQLVVAMVADPDCEVGLDHDFYKEAVERSQEDETILEALLDAIQEVCKEIAKLTMNDAYQAHVGALRMFMRHIALVEVFTQLESFNNLEIPAEKIETDTLLGPIFALSPIQGQVAVTYFQGAQTQNQGAIRNNQKMAQMTLKTHQEQLFDIANCIVKSSKSSRERLLDWFANVVNKNHKRRAIHVDENTVASDGFMVNMTAVLDRFCENFMDNTYSKVDRIDVNYFRRNPRIKIDDETKINADQKTSDEFWQQSASGENNFISEVFFLAVAAHHYGTEATNSKLSQMKRELKHLESKLKELEAQRSRFASNPNQLRVFESHLSRYKAKLEQGQCILHAIQGILLDETGQQRSMLLMRYVIVWLMRLVAPGSEYPKSQIVLPLPEQQPDVFKCLPEYFVEDIVDHFKFVTMQNPWIIMSSQLEELLTMCITFLRSSEYIKNPGVKSGLVQILYYGVLPFQGKPKGLLGDTLNGSKFALKHLLHALMKFYIEAESTGAHTQFYDKFNIRYEIFQVIRCIWSNPIYRNNLDNESKVNHDFFVRFVNLTLNDVTFLLDESFGAFRQIHSLQVELKEPYVLAFSEDEKKKKEEMLEENQRKAKSWMQLTNETISMLRLFTEALAEAFTSPEIVQRLADMLDYNLDSMAGQRQKDLKVENPAQYHFKPLELLNDLISVYLNLKDKPNFVLAVAKDERSFKHEVFSHAADIVARSNSALKSPPEIKAYHKMIDEIQSTKEAAEQEEAWLGDIPDEYLDPILATLMEDPVILPISHNTVDRSMIRSHLLSDPHDPFNRTPLKIEDVIPDTELKARIDAFRAEAREKARKAIEERKAKEGGAGGGGEKMDVETGESLVEANTDVEAASSSSKRKANEELEGQPSEKMDISEG